MRFQSARALKQLIPDTQSTLVSRIAIAVAICSLGWAITTGSGQVTAQTTPTRIAVIDVPRVLSQSNPGKASFQRLKQMQDERVARARVMEDEMKRLEGQLSAGTTLPQAQRDSLARQISDKRVVMKRFAEDAEKEMNDARVRELQGLEAKIKPVVDAMGKEMNLAGIFNKFESGLVFAADSIDITDAVIRRFNTTPVTPPAPAKP